MPGGEQDPPQSEHVSSSDAATDRLIEGGGGALLRSTYRFSTPLLLSRTDKRNFEEGAPLAAFPRQVASRLCVCGCVCGCGYVCVCVCCCVSVSVPVPVYVYII